MWTVYLTLNRPSPLAAHSETSGLKVEVEENSSQVAIHNVDAADGDEARGKALSAANQFLNTLSWKHDCHLAVGSNAERVEYVTPTGQKHVSVRVGDGSISIRERAIVVKKDASGNIIEARDSQKLGRIGVKPSDAAAYYRQAHLTNDPFERFRNLYLAVENIADRIRTDKGLSKKQFSEHSLLQLALDTCFAKDMQPLIKVAKRVYALDKKQGIIPKVAEILYKALRCQLNHSKASEDKKVPFNPQDEEEVKSALPLMDLVAKSLLGYEESSLPK